MRFELRQNCTAGTVVFFGLFQSQAMVLVTGFLFTTNKRIHFPQADRTNKRQGIFCRHGQGDAPAARTGVLLCRFFGGLWLLAVPAAAKNLVWDITVVHRLQSTTPNKRLNAKAFALCGTRLGDSVSKTFAAFDKAGETFDMTVFTWITRKSGNPVSPDSRQND